ncbi:MAG: hypothetical protein R3281_15645, partial [Balneolaceae bacterium]|nr:hypothetical protein [Balneolaceae bacterium]
ERIRKSSRWSFWKKNVYTSIFLNKNLFTTISYGFFFKGMWLLVAILGMTEASGSNGVSRVTWQFASPLILFLYTGINFFGYSKNLFFTSAIRETNFRNLASLFFATIGIIMIVDSMLFWGFIWAADQIQWVHILFYYTSVVVLAVISFWVAIYNPIFTDNFLFFDFGIIKNRGKDFNFWGVGLLVLVSFILDEIRYTDYQLIISIAGVFAALMSLYYLKEVDYFKIARSAFSRMHNL